MASKLTTRFFASIGLDIEDYDIELLSCTKSEFDNNLYILSFEKETAWTPKDLSIFMESLNNITTYKYEIHFSYKEEILAENAIEIINDKYFSLT